MTINDGVKRTFEGQVETQVLLDAKGILHPVPVSNLRADARIEPLDDKSQCTHFDEHTGRQNCLLVR